MAESKRVVLVGISGVGKTTLLEAVVEKLRDAAKTVLVRNFGTVMLDEAKRNGIKDRDMIRNLSIRDQETLQGTAAASIAAESADIIIIDTHAFVSTSAGYYPGLPVKVLDILKPTIYISVSARPEEIYHRRMNDPTRNRDRIDTNAIKQELDLQAAMVCACAVVSGSPIKPVVNRKGKVDDAANDVIRAIGL